MNKQQNISTILSLQTGWNKAQLTSMKAADVTGLLALLETEDWGHDDELDGSIELASIVGSKVKQSYRVKYAQQAKDARHVAKTASGRATLNNGDQLALLLEDATPIQTCHVLDSLLVYLHGTTYAKYTTDRIGQTHPKTGVALKALNDGMVRMNAGNQIRSYCKKATEPAAAIAAIRQILMEHTAQNFVGPVLAMAA